MSNNKQNKSEISITRLNSFDGIEIKKARFFNQSFPKHIHEEWSLALIETGAERLQFDQLEISLQAGSLVLIPPNVPHANSGYSNTPWTYKAVYIHPEILRHILKSLPTDLYPKNQIHYILSYKKKLVNEFNKLDTAITEKKNLETRFAMLLQQLLMVNTENKLCLNKKDQSIYLNEITNYLKSTVYNKITLDRLADRFKMDKFHLLRLFKSYTGISPHEYLTSLRIEKAKKLIFGKYEIVDISLECGFYDQSHFTNTFKKFVGLSPHEYRKNCNILQD